MFILFSVLGPPTLSGPATAVAFYRVIQRRERRLLRLFWILLPVVNIASMTWIAFTMGDVFGSGDLACLLIPFSALLTAFVLILLRKRVSVAVGDEAQWLGSYRLGTVLIPVFQLVTMFVLMVVAPLLCEWGVRTCWDW